MGRLGGRDVGPGGIPVQSWVFESPAGVLDAGIRRGFGAEVRLTWGAALATPELSVPRQHPPPPVSHGRAAPPSGLFLASLGPLGLHRTWPPIPSRAL